MYAKTIIKNVLKRIWFSENKLGRTTDNPEKGQSSMTSLLIYDIFGGEILKTHKKKGWHFYNLIDGERIDFTCSESCKANEDSHFEDLPSKPDETYNYFEQVDYSSFYMRFITEFEEAVTLEKNRFDFIS